ncbi:MAG: hypothetical protein ACTSRX_11490, partial [Promethearchaeota archaeon]
EGDENKVVPRMFGVDAKTFGLNVVPIKSITRINENDELKIGNTVSCLWRIYIIFPNYKC